MHLLRSRCSSRFNRIDISYLNFIYKYYSKKHEFHSINIKLNKSFMPDSTTSDSIWFQMAINAMDQLRIYWLPRYLNQLSSLSQPKINHLTIELNQNQINNDIKSLSQNPSITSLDHLSNNNSIIEESKFIKFTLDNISYLNYNPQQYIPIQSSEEHDFQQDIGSINDNNKFQVPLYPYSNRSIEDYAIDTNIELFYRIFVSDSLAGLPFYEYISQIIPKIDTISYEICLHFIADIEVFFSLPNGIFKEKILQQIITQYLEITANKKLPDEIFDNNDEQRIELIQELIKKNNIQNSLLWKILLKITKYLIPHFLNYIKFDRLRFLIQGKSLSTNPIINDLRHISPSINFDILLIDRKNTKEINFYEKENLSKTNFINCGEQEKNFRELLITNQYNTTEKYINTDEQCEFRSGERFPPLTDNELEEELRQFCTKFQSKDIITILGKSFDASITHHPTDITTFIGDPLSKHKIEQTLLTNEYSRSNLIETFTLDIMNSARKILEIDDFISNLMDESLTIFQKNNSLLPIETDQNSSQLSLLFDNILLPDSSSTTTLPELIPNNINTNALVSSNFQINLSNQEHITIPISINRKILSLIGSYFINPPDIIKTNDDIISQSHSSFKLENTSMINNKKLNEKEIFFSELIKFAQKDKSNEINNIFNKKNHLSYFQNNDQEELLKFIQNHITNHQWPLHEYIGIKGQRAWRALKLAIDISNFDKKLILNYHNDLDWILIDNELGSFGEQNYLIIRNFQRRIEQSKPIY